MLKLSPTGFNKLNKLGNSGFISQIAATRKVFPCNDVIMQCLDNILDVKQHTIIHRLKTGNLQ